MDILEKIIQNIIDRKGESWKGFHIENELNSVLSDESRRVPLIPSILQEGEQEKDEMFLIAEIKQASPSQGIICHDFDPQGIARTYIESGVDAISVLTEEDYFKGSIADLMSVRKLTNTVPLLRKDFIIHPYQVWEAYRAGADIVLLIVAVLQDDMLRFLYDYIVDFGMTALVEVHNKEELDRALKIDPVLIGINNRNLKTFDVTIESSLSLIEDIPKNISVLSESGIFNRSDSSLLHTHGFSGLLVGQSILEKDNKKELIRDLKLKEEM